MYQFQFWEDYILRIHKTFFRACVSVISYTESFSHRSPNGHNIRSLTILVATSPPLCNATAPTIAYSACDVTARTPEPLRFVICGVKRQLHSVRIVDQLRDVNILFWASIVSRCQLHISQQAEPSFPHLVSGFYSPRSHRLGRQVLDVGMAPVRIDLASLGTALRRSCAGDRGMFGDLLSSSLPNTGH